MYIEEGLQITAVCLPVTNPRVCQIENITTAIQLKASLATPSRTRSRRLTMSLDGSGTATLLSTTPAGALSAPAQRQRQYPGTAFDNMTFRSPNWGTERLPLPRSPRAASPSLSRMPQQQKPQSPGDSGPSSQFGPPTINAPEGDGLGAGPRLHIIPTTPVSGGGAAGGCRRAGVPGDVASRGGVFVFPPPGWAPISSDRMLTRRFSSSVTEQQDEYSVEKQQSNIYDPAPPPIPYIGPPPHRLQRLRPFQS
ncbi:hypothetical protein B0H14DRAFT_3146471 [Mycena olivaceomarginata]|nr:hypothetical protein B0H14DRAFT_3146471 [Mycena olivaceomarginata]